MSGPAVRVVKLGGSLLERDDLAGRLEAWFARQSPACNVLVVGGGRFVELLREWDRRAGVPAETMHWLAVRAMSITAALVAELLPDARCAATLDELRRNESGGVQIFDVERFLRDDGRRRDALPQDWRVTSDSIAARIAAQIDADELVLLKSTLPAERGDLESWTREGFVDGYFANAAEGLAVRAVDLRDGCFAESKPLSGRVH